MFQSDNKRRQVAPKSDARHICHFPFVAMVNASDAEGPRRFGFPVARGIRRGLAAAFSQRGARPSSTLIKPMPGLRPESQEHSNQ